MKVKKLVIGSTNKAKIEEWTKFFEDFLEVLKVDNLSAIEETGETFAENARLKAKHYAAKTGEYTFVEDGGFEIDFLGGAPGVHSRRLLSGEKDATDQEIVDFVLNKLKGVPKEKRTSRLKVAVAISDPKGNIIFEDFGAIEGYVLEERDGEPLIEGYPYRNLLFIPELNKTYAQASDEDHQKINHKLVIANKIKKFLLNYN